VLDERLRGTRDAANRARTNIDKNAWEEQQARKQADVTNARDRAETQRIRDVFLGAQQAAAAELEYRIDRLKQVHAMDSKSLSLNDDD
jgi:hypothetical protein